MVLRPFALACLLCALGCRPPATTVASGAAGRAAAAIDIEPLVEGVWLHRSSRYVEGFGQVESNGLVVAHHAGVLLVDTAWTPAQTASLLDWAEQHVGPVRAVLVTHWHADRTGGLAEVHRRGIPSWGSAGTSAETAAHGVVGPTELFEGQLELEMLGVRGEAFFPGAGHSTDNVVVWLADAQVLFGGCLVKSAQAEDLGNVADGDLEAWPESVRRVMVRYPQARLVVPGHGVPGGADLLVHTRDLLRAE